MGKRYFLNWERYHKNYYEESNEGYFFEVDIQYPGNLHNLHNDLPFLTERVENL